MRTITVKVLQFSELDDKGKERAKQDYAALFGYHHADEALKSLGKLAEHFGGKMTNYSVDFFATSHSSATFEMDDEMSKAEIRRRLMQLGTYDRQTLRGNGDCKLTGMCLDEDAIDGFRIAFIRGKELNLTCLMRAAFKSWLKACQADAEDQYTDETFGEHCEANGYEFFESGKFAKKGG